MDIAARLPHALQGLNNVRCIKSGIKGIHKVAQGIHKRVCSNPLLNPIGIVHIGGFGLDAVDTKCYQHGIHSVPGQYKSCTTNLRLLAKNDKCQLGMAYNGIQNRIPGLLA